MRPVNDEQQLANIEHMEWEDLKNDFKQQCNAFMDSLKMSARPKELHGKVLNTSMLLGLAMDFCESVNQESISKIESSVSRLISEETRVIQDDAYMDLKMMLEDEIGMDPINEA